MIALLCGGMLATGLVAHSGPERAGDAASAAGEFRLTDAERAWIAAHPVIRAGHDPSFIPYAIRDQAGRITGLDVDFLELVAGRTGLKFVHESRSNWPEMLAAFRAGEVDILGSMAATPEREAYMAFSQPYTLAPNVIITRSDSPYLFDMRELEGRTVAVPRGYAGLLDDIAERAPGAQVVEYGTSLECYQAVSAGRVFASIGDAANATYLIKHNRIPNLRLGSVVSESAEIQFGIRKDWPELTALINRVIASITPLERQEINNRWIAIDFQEDQRWAKAFRVAAALVAGALLVALLVFLHNRSLARELAERRRVQRELEEARDQRARVSEEKSELLRMVAHDLRSPLTGVLLGTDILRAGGLDPRAADDALARMRVALQQVLRLANDLVEVGALESGQRQLVRVEADAASVMRESVLGLSEAAARKGIRLVLREAEPLRVWTDPSALRQIADNLLTNAVKFSPAGARVEAGIEARTAGLKLWVRDNGPGLSAEDQRRLFRKYERGSARPTGGEKSTGLGLWIVHRLVEGLGGTVRCESEPGRGALFVVELPAGVPSAA
ncbi:MAG TPA: transporter substrate-binding domain-containing protein [Opitutaceae bacterium]|nr:transporter substrate-binding domain-containing protein [Opitutaceae bacterium]